jgi:hypothetical protein
MPLSATTEQIKAYQAQVEKDKITHRGCPHVRFANWNRYFSNTNH